MVSSAETAKCATNKGAVPFHRSTSVSVRLDPTGKSALGMACATAEESVPATLDSVAEHAALPQVHILNKSHHKLPTSGLMCLHTSKRYLVDSSDNNDVLSCSSSE